MLIHASRSIVVLGETIEPFEGAVVVSGARVEVALLVAARCEFHIVGIVSGLCRGTKTDHYRDICYQEPHVEIFGRYAPSAKVLGA